MAYSGSPAPRRPALAPPSNQPQADGFAVLVVEDEYFIALDISLALQAAGARVLGPVGQLKSALRILGSDRVDRAVLDVNLGGDTVFLLADELAARNIPFVFATGYDAVVIPERHRAAPRLEKPYDATALAALLIGMAAGPAPSGAAK